MATPLPPLREPLLELLHRASTRLPGDVLLALRTAQAREVPSGLAANTLGTMLENSELATACGLPLCQDTGTVLFWVQHPFGLSQRALKAELRSAVAEATERSWLRPNCVEALSGRNPGTNLDPYGEGHPVIHFEEWPRPELEITVMLKGGGCENVGAQYRLPDASLGAGRDLEGVRRAILDAVLKAQGQGCAPGILGVAIGGDRATGYARSKELLLRRLGTPNPDPRLDAFEHEVMADLNSLGIGPMGSGGRATALGLFVEEMYRHPASFFVSISYMCWSNRRLTLRVGADGTTVLEEGKP